MPHQLVILPIVLPLLAGVVNLILHKRRSAGSAVTIAALAGSLLAAVWMVLTLYGGPGATGGVMASQMGNWPAPFGITVIADLFSACLLVVAGLVTLAAYCHALTQASPRFTGGYFNALLPLMTAGVNWAFLAGDLFNLFVSFEVLLLASYGLLVSGTTPRQMRHAHKYVILNLIVSAVFVMGCGWVYGTTGTLNFAEMAVLSRTGAIDSRAALAVVAVGFVFATKAAAFPMWYWLPESYPTLPPSVGGLYAGLLTKVGVYAMVRLFVTAFGGADVVAEALSPLLVVSAAGTMFLGVLGAVGSGTVRRILSVHVISQVGYMILGITLAVGSTEAVAAVAVAATLLYMVQHMVVKCGLFLCCGSMEKYSGTDDLSRMGGLVSRDTWLATIFLIAALSLVGLPPLSGFFGKYLLIAQSFERGGPSGIFLAIVAIATGALTLLSMAKIWSYGFWSPAPAGTLSATRPDGYRPARRTSGLWSATALVIAALLIGLCAGPIYDLAVVAGEGVASPRAYVEAALGTHAADLLPAEPITMEVTP